MLGGNIREQEKVIRQSGKTDSFNQNKVMREITFQNPFKVKSFEFFMVLAWLIFSNVIKLFSIFVF